MQRKKFNIEISGSLTDSEQDDVTNLQDSLQRNIQGHLRKHIQEISPSNEFNGAVYRVMTYGEATDLIIPDICYSLARDGWGFVTYDSEAIYLSPIVPSPEEDIEYSFAGYSDSPFELPPIRRVPEIDLPVHSRTDEAALEDVAKSVQAQFPNEHLAKIENIIEFSSSYLIRMSEEVSEESVVQNDHHLCLETATRAFLAEGTALTNVLSDSTLSFAPVVASQSARGNTCRGYSFIFDGDNGSNHLAPKACHNCQEQEGYIRLITGREQGHVVDRESGSTEEVSTPVVELFCGDCAKQTDFERFEEEMM